VRVTDDDPLAILVSPEKVNLREGSSELVSVTLNGSPTTPVDVAVGIEQGSALGIAPEVLSFDKSDWSKPHILTLSAQASSAETPFAETVSLTGRLLVPAAMEVTLSGLEPAGVGGEAFEASGASGVSSEAGASGGVSPGNDAGQPTGGRGDSIASSKTVTESSCSCRLPHDSGDSGQLSWLLAVLLLRRRRAARCATVPAA
jgi:hypothetical protein